MYRSSKMPFLSIMAVVLMNASFYSVKAAEFSMYSPTTTAVRYYTEVTSRRGGHSSKMFGRRNINKSSVSAVNNLSRRKSSSHSAHVDSPLVLNVKRKKASRKVVAEERIAENSETESVSFQEMKKNLGPFSLLVANSVEVGVVTAGSYMSGGVFGYVIGGAMSVPSLFKPFPTVETSAMDILRKKIANCNTSAFAQAKSWGRLSAAFTGFQAAVRLGRGNKEDKWNGIIGSACTGAFLNRQQGPQAMLQSASTYAGFTYMIDTFMGPNSKKKGAETDFDFKDTPVGVEERGF